MTALHENLSRAQRAIIGKQFETSHYQPIIREESNPDFPYFDSFNIRNTDRLQEAQNKGHQIFRFKELPNQLVVCDTNLPLQDDVYSHPNSYAKYRGEGERGPDYWLVNYLAPGDVTTLHVHPESLTDAELLEGQPAILAPVTEFYKVLYGSGTMHFEENDQGIAIPKEFSVRAGVSHQMEAGSEGAIFAILMKNAALYPKDIRHIPVSMAISVSG